MTIDWSKVRIPEIPLPLPEPASEERVLKDLQLWLQQARRLVEEDDSRDALARKLKMESDNKKPPK